MEPHKYSCGFQARLVRGLRRRASHIFAEQKRLRQSYADLTEARRARFHQESSDLSSSFRSAHDALKAEYLNPTPSLQWRVRQPNPRSSEAKDASYEQAYPEVCSEQSHRPASVNPIST